MYTYKQYIYDRLSWCSLIIYINASILRVSFLKGPFEDKGDNLWLKDVWKRFHAKLIGALKTASKVQGL